MYPKSLQNAIDQLRKLPGVGQKTAERYAMTLLNQSEDEIKQFAEAIVNAKINLHPCPICGNLAEKDQCDICLDAKRDRSTICVVQDIRDVAAIERSHEYKGLYHVLRGAISTQKGILPEDINLETLMPRLGDTVKEVIIATNPTVEGEATATYLSQQLKRAGVKVTRIAMGIPVGSDIEYTDEITMMKAMEGRREL